MGNQATLKADTEKFTPPRVETMGKLKTANHLLGDRKALDEAFERDGYWYFKGVLDKDVIAEFRQNWIEYLQRHGLIDPGVNENRYNGSGFEGKAIDRAELSRLSEFNEKNLHTFLTTHPKIVATMTEILGVEPFWLPIAEYRANPPSESPDTENRLIYPHQDGFYSRGLDMRICWIPVDTVDADTGGCAWVEGAHKGPILHDLNNPPVFPIPPESIPRDGWRRADFEPGDIVIFHLNTPHSGLTNISKDRFRMSMDIRIVDPAAKTMPSIGSVQHLTPDQVTIRNELTDTEETYALTPDTYVRSTDGKKREGAEIPTVFKLGEKVIVNSDDGKTATLLRSVH